MLADDLAKKLAESRLIQVAVQPEDGVGVKLAEICRTVNKTTPITNSSQLLRHIIYDYHRLTVAEQKQGAA